MRTLIIAAAIAAGPALAGELSLEVPGLSMTLQDGACADAVVLRTLHSQYWPRFKAGAMELDGKPVRICWTDEGKVRYVHFEDGSGMRIPKEAFKERTGT